jgi:thiamine-phosphate pyrophosphorylase
MASFSASSTSNKSFWRREELIERLTLHVLTDRERSRGRDTFSVASAALEGGATVIQLRDKQASTRQLVEEGLMLRRVTYERGALLIVNDRIDVALAVDADGAHIGQDDDMPVQLARKLLGSERILGISAGNQAEAAAAIAANADYISVGPIYATRAKSDAGAPIGTQLLTELAASTFTPLIAIGGITAMNVDAVIQAGAIGVAVITAVVGAEDVALATRSIFSAFKSC